MITLSSEWIIRIKENAQKMGMSHRQTDVLLSMLCHKNSIATEVVDESKKWFNDSTNCARFLIMMAASIENGTSFDNALEKLKEFYHGHEMVVNCLVSLKEECKKNPQETIALVSICIAQSNKSLAQMFLLRGKTMSLSDAFVHARNHIMGR